jgi:hypothetical protein
MMAALFNALLFVLAFVGFVVLVGVGCLHFLLEVDELRLTRSSQSPDPRTTRDEDAYLVTSERLRVLELDALARLAAVRRRAETEHDGRSQ